MKKVSRKSTFLAVIFSCLLLSACGNSIPEIKKHALSCAPCEYRNIQTSYEYCGCPETVTYGQVQKDLDELCYILKNCYAGYDEAVLRGLNLDEFKKNVCHRIFAQDPHIFYQNELITAKNKDFLCAIKDELKDKINDSHFMLWLGDYDFWWKLCEKSFVFYSDLFVEKKNGSYYLVEKELPDSNSLGFYGLKEGQKYFGKEENLFYYPSKGENVYRIGIFTPWAESLSVQIDGNSVLVPVSSEVAIWVRQSLRYGEKFTDKSAYISISRLLSPDESSRHRKGAEKNLKRFCAAGKDCQDKENVILDLRSNGGGNDTYVLYFLTGLYVQKEKIAREKVFDDYINAVAAIISEKQNQNKNVCVLSPCVLQGEVEYIKKFCPDVQYFPVFKKLLKYFKKNCFRITVEAKEIFKSGVDVNKIAKIKESISEPYFKGKLYILIDRNTGSSAEETVIFAKHLFGDNVILVGENSSGCMSYGNIVYYRLNESKIAIQASYSDFTGCMNGLDSWHGEGKGFFPDVWTERSNLLDTLRILIDDPALPEKIQYLDSALQ